MFELSNNEFKNPWVLFVLLALLMRNMSGIECLVRPMKNSDLLIVIRGDSNNEAFTAENTKPVGSLEEKTKLMDYIRDSELGLPHPGSKASGSTGTGIKKQNN